MACSEDLKIIIGLIKGILLVAQIVIPILLIIWGTIDLGKAVVASKEEDIKKAQGTLIKRIITAILVFLLSTIVSFALGLVGGTEWKECWKDSGTSICPSGQTYDPVSGSCK
jgi:large-conductance mechanosensitive channel